MEKQYISRIISLMLIFQQLNNIDKQCVTNTQYLYDCIKYNFPNYNVKAKAFICIIDDILDTTIFITHLAVIIDDDIYEPSYELYKYKNKKYIDSIKNINFNKTPNDFDKNQLLSNFIKMIKIANEINNGEIIIANRLFYDNQANFIEKIFKN
jgi:hypothetical protein